MFSHNEMRILFKQYIQKYSAQRLREAKKVNKSDLAYFEAAFKIIKSFFQKVPSDESLNFIDASRLKRFKIDFNNTDSLFDKLEEGFSCSSNCQNSDPIETIKSVLALSMKYNG
jgi:hypothetical protein